MLVAALCRQWPGRCFAAVSGARAPAAQWPDLRLWIQRLPDGTAALSRRRSPAATIALDVYSQQMPGTRELRLGATRFFAFQAPRLGAEHMIVWRRIQDVREAAAAWQRSAGSPTDLDVAAPLRVTPIGEHQQLTAAVWRWDEQGVRDPNRYWDDGAGGEWMYWESFWAPSEEAALATASPAFGDATGSMLAPVLGAEATSTSEQYEALDLGAQSLETEQAVSSTATATAVKDRAYAVVYQFNVWGSDVSRSGTGSDFWSPEARLAVTALSAVIDRFAVRSMLDCACGDATWIVPYFVRRHREIAYCGIDIVPEVIEENQRRHPDLKFLSIDLAESPLPAGADLVFSKETLNHMDLADAQRTLARFRATGAKYLLTNVHQGAQNELGRRKACFTTYIRYDYELPPFNLKKLASIIEYQGPRTSFSLFSLSANDG